MLIQHSPTCGGHSSASCSPSVSRSNRAEVGRGRHLRNWKVLAREGIGSDRLLHCYILQNHVKSVEGSSLNHVPCHLRFPLSASRCLQHKTAFYIPIHTKSQTTHRDLFSHCHGGQNASTQPVLSKIEVHQAILWSLGITDNQSCINKDNCIGFFVQGYNFQKKRKKELFL